MVSHILRLIDNISKWTGRAASFLIVVITLVMVFEVVARYILNRPTIWASEITGMLFGTYCLLGGAITLYMGKHVNMDVIYTRLSPKGKATIDIITFWFFVLFCIALIWKGGEVGWRSVMTLEHSGSVWNPPVYYFKMMLPIGAFLLLLQGIAKFTRDVMTIVSGRPS
jgi:TRAP-type mannitol/chloroaromatic compound transport system permease small subunit